MTGKPHWLVRWGQSGLQLTALLLAATLPALFDHGYRLLDAEVLVIGAGMMGSGLLLSLAVVKLPLLGRLLFAALVVLVLDVYFLVAWPVVLLVAVAIIAVHCTRFEPEWRNIATLFALIFVVLSAQSSYRSVLEPALSTGSTAKAVGSRNPLVLHIVLDEQGSPLTASAAMRASGRLDKLLDSYVQRGFFVQTSVRAVSGATQVSLSRVFGPENLKPDQTNVSSIAGAFSNRIRNNELLRELGHHGYAVSVVQNTFLQLCAPDAADCHTYQRANYGHAMRRFNNKFSTRLWLAGALLHTELLDTQGDRGAFLYKLMSGLAAQLGIGYVVESRHYWARPAAVLEVLDNLESQVRYMQPGQAWVLHLLLPHFPYVLDSQCELRSHKDWSVPAWVSETAPDKELLARLETDYWQQSECVHSRVLAIVDQLDGALGRENVRVLIHGDHGARLAAKQPEPEASELLASDPNGSLDTVMLLRAPGQAPGVSSERVPLVEAVRRSYGLLQQ